MNTETLWNRAEAIAQIGAWNWDLEQDQWTFTNGFRRIHGLPDLEPITMGVLLERAHPEDRPAIEDAFKKAFASEQPYDIEHRIVRQDNGEVRSVHARGEVIFDTEGRAIRLDGVTQDITDRKQMEQTNARLAAAVASSADAILTIDSNGMITSWNRGAETLFGYSNTEILGEPITLLFPQELAEDRTWVYSALARGEAVEQYATKRLAKDGRVIDVSVTISPLKDANGKVIGASAMLRDISARMRLEAALQVSNAQFAAALESSAELVWGVDAHYGYLFGNRAIRMQLAHYYGRELAPGECVLNMPVPDGVRQQWRSDFDRALQGESFSVETRVTANGQWYEYHYRPIIDAAGQIHGVIAAGNDITARKEEETALRIENDLGHALSGVDDVYHAFELILDAIISLEGIDGGGIYLVDPTGALDLVTHRQLSAQFIAAVSHYPADTLQAALLRNGQVSYGTYQEMLFEPNPATDQEGLRCVGVVPMVHQGESLAVLAIASKTQDTITPITRKILETLTIHFSSILLRLRATAALKESEERFHRMFAEHAAVMLLIDPATGAIVDANLAAANFYGYSAAKLQSMNITDINALAHAEIYTQLQRAFSSVRNDFLFPHRLADGTLRDVEVHSSPINVGDSQILFSIIHDVTARRQAEEALCESERKYRDLYDHSPDMYMSGYVDDHIIRDCNQTLLAVLGYTRDDLIGQSVQKLIEPGSFRRLQELLPEYHKAGEYHNLEVKIRRKDGTWLDVLMSGALESNLPQTPTLSRVTLHDITERKNTERERLDQAQRFTALIENTDDRIWAIDREYRLIVANSTFQNGNTAAFGRNLAPGESVLISDAPATVNELWQSYFDRALGGERFSIETQTQFAQQPGYREYRFNPIYNAEGQITGAVIFGRDTTKRRHAEEAIKVNLVKYSTLFDIAPIGITITDDRGNILETNRMAEHILSVPKWAHEQRTYDGPEWKIVCPDGSPMPAAEYASVRAAAEGKVIENVMMGIVKDPEPTTWISVNAAPIPLPGYGVVITYSDITHHHQLEEALRASEARYRLLAENMTDVVWVLDTDTGYFTYVSPSVERMLLMPMTEVMNTPAFAKLTPQSCEYAAAMIQQAVYDFRKDQASPEATYEIAQYCSDGSIVWTENVGKLYRSADTGHIELYGVARNITERKRAETALATSEARLKAVIENTGENIWSVDQHYCLLVANSTFLRGVQTQIGRPFAIGESVLNAFPATTRAYWQTQYDTVLAGESVAFELESHWSPGHTLEWRLSPISDANGVVTGIVGQSRDVTERLALEMQLRESLQRLQLAVNAAEIGIWNWNFADNSLDWDERMCKLYAIPQDAQKAGLYLAVWRARVHPDDRAIAEPVVDAATQTYLENAATFRIVMPDGQIRHIQSGYVIEHDRRGAPLRLIGINRDVTQQKAYELLLQQTNADLEVRVTERTTQLESAVADLQHAEELKDAFLAAVSHELRTPLIGVLGMADALDMQVAGQLNERQLHYVRQIHHSGQRLLKLVNSILHFTALVAGRVVLTPEPCRLLELGAVALRAQREHAEAKSQKLALSVEPNELQIVSDVDSILHILDNLLDNAVKFTPEGGEIGLDIDDDCEHGSIHVTVWDTGAGIAPEDHQRIFNTFEQLDHGLHRQYEGVGLGLAYVSELLRLIGGTIAVESELGSGSRFIITLPTHYQPRNGYSHKNSRPKKH